MNLEETDISRNTIKSEKKDSSMIWEQNALKKEQVKNKKKLTKIRPII